MKAGVDWSGTVCCSHIAGKQCHPYMYFAHLRRLVCTNQERTSEVDSNEPEGWSFFYLALWERPLDTVGLESVKN